MSDPDLRLAILKQMASIRHELATLRSEQLPLGPREFLDRYEQHLNACLERLEQALKSAEE